MDLLDGNIYKLATHNTESLARHIQAQFEINSHLIAILPKMYLPALLGHIVKSDISLK